MARILKNLAIGLFLVLWILPVLYSGTINRPPPCLPKTISRWVDVSRLFSAEYRNWAVYEIQVKRSGNVDYQPLPEEPLFAMHPFGYRTRLQRILDLSTPKRRQALADWLIRKENSMPTSGQIVAIRFVVFPYTIDPGVPPVGHYHQPMSKDVPPQEIRIISTHESPAANK